jgi:hypothetical protein
LTPYEVAEILRTLERKGVFSQRRNTPSKLLEELLINVEEKSIDEEKKEKLQKLAAIGEVFIKTISSPSTCSSADLEMLTETIKNASRLRRDDADQKSHDNAAIKVRELLVRIMMPAIRELVIPKWIYDSLEKRLVDMRERLRHKELELERLKRLLKARGIMPATSKLYIVSGLLEEVPVMPSGETAKLICPSCGEINIVTLPSVEAIEEAHKQHWVFRAHCQYCAKIIDLEPYRLLSMMDVKKKEPLIPNRAVSNTST